MQAVVEVAVGGDVAYRRAVHVAGKVNDGDVGMACEDERAERTAPSPSM